MDNSENTFQQEPAGDWRISKLKEYGKEAYRPFVDLLFKYQDALVPYLRSLSHGLHSGREGLAGEGSPSPEIDRFVSGFFNETARGIDELIRVLESKDTKAISTFLKNMSDRSPSLAFSTSYVAGLFIGRLSKHIVTEKKLVKEASLQVQAPPFEGHIH